MAGDRRRRRRQQQVRPSQDPASRLGKLLRLDPNVPATPPVETLAVGLRNPFRFSFAPDGTIVIADVGQNQWRRSTSASRANYGWPCREGRTTTCPTRAATTSRPRTRSWSSPTAPAGSARSSAATSCATRPADAAGPVRLRRLLQPGPALGRPGDAGLGRRRRHRRQRAWPFGEDACGRVLVVSLAGPVSRIVDGTATPCDGATPTPTATPHTHVHADSDGDGDGVLSRSARASRLGAAHRRPAALQDHDAHHRPALAPPPRLPSLRAAHRRGLPGDDQRARLPRGHDPPQRPAPAESSSCAGRRAARARSRSGSSARRRRQPPHAPPERVRWVRDFDPGIIPLRNASTNRRWSSRVSRPYSAPTRPGPRRTVVAVADHRGDLRPRR